MAGAVAVVLAVVGPAPPAPADPGSDPSVSLDAPAVDGATATVSGSVHMSGPLDWVTGVAITVTSRQHPDATASCSPCGATLDQSPSASFSFTTSGLAYNGPYDVSVVASGQKIIGAVTNGAPVSTQATTAFKVEVAPAPPADVTVVANGDHSVTVSWTRNTEADLLGYQVERRTGTAGFQPVGPVVPQPPEGASTVHWTDPSTAATGGQFEYLVVAVRPDADGAVSDRATSASTGVGVSVPVPPGVVGAPGPGGAATTRPATPGSSTKAAASLNLSSFPNPGATPPEISSPDTPDGGFSPALNYGSRDRGDTVGGGSEAVLSGSTDRRALLLPVAAGLLLCMVSAHLRRFNRRVLAPMPALEPGGAHRRGAVPVGSGRARGVARRLPPRTGQDRRPGSPTLRPGERRPGRSHRRPAGRRSGVGASPRRP
ncbi:MAG: hypothetical protein ACR2LJ_02745 [Acidimicrobiales bacterium]